MKRFTTLLLFIAVNSYAQKKTVPNQAETALSNLKASTLQFLEGSYPADKRTALQIWDYAELGYKETKSAALHVQNLKEAGFSS
jgi:aminobenzoyl-glutamate utilization protein B